MPCGAVDGTGIKVEGEGEWHARKHGCPKRCIWRKSHLRIDEETLEIRAVEITVSHIGDAQVLLYLLNQIPEDQEIGSVAANGAYETRKCHDAIADRGAYAVIPPSSLGSPPPPARSLETRACAHPNTSAVPTCDNRVVTTAGAASRRRCIV